MDEQLLRRQLFSLEAELPSLRRNFELARTLGEFPRKEDCQHPVLQFALSRATTSVVEHLLLRLAEAIDPFLEQASVRMLGATLFNGGRGRDRKPTSRVFQYVLALRSEGIAHRVKMGGANGAEFKAVQAEFGTIWAFLESALDEVTVLLAQLRIAGFFREPGLVPVRVRYSTTFTTKDVADLVTLANTVVRKPSARGRRGSP
jgi:hypothetical protein